jgi:hypothetical protein
MLSAVLGPMIIPCKQHQISLNKSICGTPSLMKYCAVHRMHLSKRGFAFPMSSTGSYGAPCDCAEDQSPCIGVAMSQHTCPMYPIEGVTSQPQAVTACRPTHVNTGKLFSHATCEDTRVYTPAAANVHSSMDQALAHSPVSSEVSAITGQNSRSHSKGHHSSCSNCCTPAKHTSIGKSVKACAVLSRVNWDPMRTLRVELFQGPHPERTVHASQAGSA